MARKVTPPHLHPELVELPYDLVDRTPNYELPNTRPQTGERNTTDNNGALIRELFEEGPNIKRIANRSESIIVV